MSGNITSASRNSAQGQVRNSSANSTNKLIGPMIRNSGSGTQASVRKSSATITGSGHGQGSAHRPSSFNNTITSHFGYHNQKNSFDGAKKDNHSQSFTDISNKVGAARGSIASHKSSNSALGTSATKLGPKPVNGRSTSTNSNKEGGSFSGLTAAQGGSVINSKLYE